MNNNWQTSVTDLLTIFKETLSAIIPWLEKAKIKWKEGEAYDDWDNIAEALYKNIVCASLVGEVMLDYPIAKYNFNYINYSAVDFIEVKSKNQLDKRMVFISFLSNTYPLDGVKVACIDHNSNVIGYAILKSDDLFFLYIRKCENKEEIINVVKVSL